MNRREFLAQSLSTPAAAVAVVAPDVSPRAKSQAYEGKRRRLNSPEEVALVLAGRRWDAAMVAMIDSHAEGCGCDGLCSDVEHGLWQHRWLLSLIGCDLRPVADELASELAAEKKLIRLAQIVAASRGLDCDVYLERIVRPQVERDFAKIAESSL